jgi:hypothetical protein
VKELSFIEATVFAVESRPANVLLLDPSINVVDPATAGSLRRNAGFSFAAASWAGSDEADLSVRRAMAVTCLRLRG